MIFRILRKTYQSSIILLNKYLFRFIANFINKILYANYHIVWGNWINRYKRVKISKKAQLWGNALLNVNSWDIIIKDYVTFGQNISLLTWTHDYTVFNKERILKKAPIKGNDIIIEQWVRVASNATILWPCHIWENAVIASWSVVTKDVPPYVIVWWVPAKIIKKLEH